jgi:hypothetical protein
MIEFRDHQRNWTGRLFAAAAELPGSLASIPGVEIIKVNAPQL